MTQVKAEGLDLDNLPSPGTHRVVFTQDEDGEDKAGFIIVGKNSAEYQAESKEIRKEALMRSQKRKSALDASTEEGAKVVAKLISSNEKRLALCVVTGWFGINKGGQPATFDKVVASALLDKYPTWVDKISADLEKDTNFLKG